MSLPTPKRAVLVLGARSQIGEYLVPLLLEAGYRVVAVTRRRSGGERELPGLEWIDMPPPGEAFASAEALVAAIALAPLAIVPPLIAQLASSKVTRLIAFSSTSLFTKHASADGAERAFVETLRRAEGQIESECGKFGIAWTIFRPTLVYSWGMDKNVSEIGRFIRRFHFFPLLGRGVGMRQPVHAEDLALACRAALANVSTHGKRYNLVGARRITYRAMVEEVYRAVGMRPRIVAVPAWAIRAAIRCARWLPRYRHLSPELATRMDTDMCFDSTEAAADFGFAPRPFDLAVSRVRKASPETAATAEIDGGAR